MPEQRPACFIGADDRRREHRRVQRIDARLRRCGERLFESPVGERDDLAPDVIFGRRAAMADALEVNRVVVGQVVAGTPAAQAGLQPGDVIVGIGDVTVKSQQDLQEALTSTFRPGDTVAVKINCGGTDQTVRVTLGTKPAS